MKQFDALVARIGNLLPTSVAVQQDLFVKINRQDLGIVNHFLL